MLFMKRMKLLFTLAIPVLLCQDIQAQISSRLIAAAHWSNNGAMFKQVDSSAYAYSGTVRGGDLKHPMLYDNGTTWVYVNDSAYENSTATLQTFDANNNVLTATNEYWSGTSWVLNTKMIYTYNSSNQVLTAIMQTWDGTSWVSASEDVYSYNTGGKLQSDEYEVWGLAGYTGVSTKVYSYDLTNTWLINETDQNIAGSPMYTRQIAYTYDSTAHRLLTTTTSNWNGAAWVNDSLTTNTYDTAGHLITTLRQTYNTVLSRWDNTNFSLFSSFVGNMPQTEIDQVWNSTGSGSWDNASKHTNTYNSFNQLTSTQGISWNVSGSQFEYALGDPMWNYYYQTYGTNVAVNNVVSSNGEANIYPVPAQNMLHIDIKWNVAQSASIAIYDMSGRMVAPVMDVPSSTEYRAGISVNNLAAGMYQVKISGTQGEIVKQIVIAH